MKEVTGPSPPTHTHIYKISKKKPELAFASPVYQMRLKAVVPFSYDLNSRLVVKQKNSNCQWTRNPRLDPRVLFMCNSRAFRRGCVAASSLLFFVCRQCGPDRSKLFETLTVFLIFFSYTLSRNKGAEKTGGARSGLANCCSNVSCDKIHTIFKISKFNVKIYTG